MLFGRWRFLTNADYDFFGIFRFYLINDFADFGFFFFYLDFCGRGSSKRTTTRT